MSDKPGKHVIFLGAGASMSSGYPSAERLRILLTSPEDLAKYIIDRLGVEIGADKAFVYSKIKQHREPYQRAVDLFRNGGFATVDEFCFLANGRFPKEVQALKIYMGLILAMVAPERTFQTSEYYGFCQRLFESDLRTLREDIAVLSYNYDPYLEFLISRFFTVRSQACGIEAPICPPSALSGFTSVGHPISKLGGFCFLKLHGSSAFIHPHPDKRNAGPHPVETIMQQCDIGLLHSIFGRHPEVPGPIVFPWEIFDDRGVLKEEGCAWDYETGWPQKHQATFCSLLVETWKRARAEVQKARRVSFVGLSGHNYLQPGLRFMFNGRELPLDFFIANPDARGFSSLQGTLIKALDPQFNLSIQNARSIPDFKTFIADYMAPVI